MPTDQAGLGTRVREALALSFMDESGLARAIGLDPDDLLRSLDGIRDFDAVEVAQIAETLNVPVHFLLEPGSLTRSLAIAARTRPTSNGTPIRDALARCDTIVDLDDLLNELGYRESLVIPRIERSQYATGPAEEGNGAAQWVRRYLSPEDPNCDIVDLIPAIERLGIDVIIEPLDRHLDSLAITSGTYRAMLVNTKIPPTRRLYTIAHELAHLVLGDSDSRFSGDVGRQSHVIVDEDVQGRSI